MQIRKTERGHCRQCENEAWKPFFEKWLRREERIEVIRSGCEKTSNDLKRRNVGRLYALDAITASRTKTEVICADHLLELQKDIEKITNEILRTKTW
jgi:hypothetical protein